MRRAKIIEQYLTLIVIPGLGSGIPAISGIQKNKIKELVS